MRCIFGSKLTWNFLFSIFERYVLFPNRISKASSWIFNVTNSLTVDGRSFTIPSIMSTKLTNKRSQITKKKLKVKPASSSNLHNLSVEVLFRLFFCINQKFSPQKKIEKNQRTENARHRKSNNPMLNFPASDFNMRSFLRFLFQPLLRGGTIYSNGFFSVQSILADRHTHRRELRLISLECLSSVEYGIKRFFWFSFLQGNIEV